MNLLSRSSYYWTTDWIEEEDPEHKPYRLWIRGSVLAMILSLSGLVRPRVGKAALWQQRYKLFGLTIILVLKFLRVLFEVNTILYVRSMGIWGILFRVIIIFASGCYVSHFLVINALNAVIDLTWHYAFRQFSDQHVFQWELVVFIFLQVHYFIMKQKEREDFRRQIVHCMERQVSNELAAVHEFVAHHSRDAIALHSVDKQGYHCFKFVSSAIEAMTGWSPEELVGRRVTDFVHDKEKEIVENIFLKAYSDEPADADDFSMNQSYSNRLQDIQQKFSKVLTDFDDHSIRIDTVTSSSAQIVPSGMTENTNKLPESRRLPTKQSLQLPGESTWSKAVTSHEMFAKLFSPSRNLSNSFDHFYRQRTFAAESVAEISEERSEESSASPRLPKSLKYFSSPNVASDGTQSDAEDECVLGLGEDRGQDETASALSSLPSLPVSELDINEDSGSTSFEESLTFRIISKSGAPVLVQASCNNTPQGVVTVYRKLNPASSRSVTPL
eukprot:gb/GECG01014098.1/.p1 GENE.gb/GECG01014098.1/~~gb/GECG01014098.1/.p1  ORF type:complete len:499 (+),score=59.66 gb/GECG01014098.1/:1-1497(+)